MSIKDVAMFGCELSGMINIKFRPVCDLVINTIKILDGHQIMCKLILLGGVTFT